MYTYAYWQSRVYTYAMDEPDVHWEEFIPSRDEDDIWRDGDLLCGDEFIRDDYFWVYSPPGRVVSRLDCAMWYSELTEVHRFALLDNGQVWMWSITSDIDGFTPHVELCLVSVCISMIGGILGVGYSLIKLRRLSAGSIEYIH